MLSHVHWCLIFLEASACCYLGFVEVFVWCRLSFRMFSWGVLHRFWPFYRQIRAETSFQGTKSVNDYIGDVWRQLLILDPGSLLWPEIYHTGSLNLRFEVCFIGNYFRNVIYCCLLRHGGILMVSDPGHNHLFSAHVIRWIPSNAVTKVVEQL